jgi:pimeloyl-ACP methyl ester carboxylesterase
MTMPGAEVGRIEKVNGVDVYFEVHGTGEPVLLLHGFSGTSQDWTRTLAGWGDGLQLILVDLRGHGRSGILKAPFRHEDAADDTLALLDRLGIAKCKGVGISGGGNVLLHMAVKQPERVKTMVLVSATPRFPEQGRAIMRQYGTGLPEAEWERLRRAHARGDAQIEMLLASTRAFAESHDDLNFTAENLREITARTLIVQGDRDPLYPIALSEEMAAGIPNAALWVVPGGGHGPVIGALWGEFQRRAAEFLRS